MVKDMENLIKDSKALLPAGFLVITMWYWFPEYLAELVGFMGKSFIGIGIFLWAWEVWKHGKN